MKIKRFNENYNDEINVGDYVICKYTSNHYVNDFVNNNIGKIVNIDQNNIYPYTVQYENIPNDNNIRTEIIKNEKDSFVFNDSEILYHSENIIKNEDIPLLMAASKFNM